MYDDVHHTHVNAENLSRQLGPAMPAGVVGSQEDRWKSTGCENVHRAAVQRQ